MAGQLDLNALTTAIAKGVVEGTTGVVSSFTTEALRRHELAGKVQVEGEKIHELDSEVKLLKGMLVSLIGGGDGTTGMVPRLEKDMSSLKSDMVEVKGKVSELTTNVVKIAANVDTIMAKQSVQTSWRDGWKGVAIFIAIVGTCVSIMGGIGAGLLWLYSHGIAGR